MWKVTPSYFEAKTMLPPRNRADIHWTLGRLSMPVNSYFVLGGANMVLRGIKRQTTDIDVLVSDNLFAELGQRPDAEIKNPPKSAIERGASNTTVWIHSTETALPLSATTALGDGCYPMSFESHRDRVEMVDGVPCSLLEDVIAAKASLQRFKDLRDLRRIEVFTGESIILTPNPIAGPLHQS
jgi:hypothetical protein